MSQTISPPTQRSAESDAAPPGVRERAAEADRQIREMQAEVRQAQGLPPLPTPPAPGGVQDDRPQAAAPTAPQAPQPPVAPPPPVAPAPPTQPTAVDALRDQLETLRQEMRTWKGRYEAELPRERRAREEAERLVGELEAKLSEASKPTELAATPSKDELDAYGEDLFKLVERFIMPQVQQMMTQQMARLESRLEGRFNNVEGSLVKTKEQVTHTAQDRFFTKLDEQIPDWRAHDSTVAFNAWLDEFDPFFGVPRREALDTAVVNLDDARVVKVFKAFLTQKDATESQATAGPTPAPAPGTGGLPTAPAAAPASPSLGDFAAPGKPGPSQVATNQAQPGANVWTMAEIQAFYRDKAHGVFRDRPAEADRYERDIANAQREGRVMP